MNTTGKIFEEKVSSEVIKLDQTFFPTPWTTKQWEELDPLTHTLFTWRAGEELKGFALFWTTQYDDTAHLLKILLLNESRGTGAALIFWSYVRDELRRKGFKSVYLEVEAGNIRAKAFYEKVGFKVIRRNKAYYSSGEDALIMTVTL